MKYRTKEYFNDVDYYLIETVFRPYVDKLHFDQGHWWTNTGMHIKATTCRMININELS